MLNDDSSTGVQSFQSRWISKTVKVNIFKWKRWLFCRCLLFAFMKHKLPGKIFSQSKNIKNFLTTKKDAVFNFSTFKEMV